MIPCPEAWRPYFFENHWIESIDDEVAVFPAMVRVKNGKPQNYWDFSKDIKGGMDDWTTWLVLVPNNFRLKEQHHDR